MGEGSWIWGGGFFVEFEGKEDSLTWVKKSLFALNLFFYLLPAVMSDRWSGDRPSLTMSPVLGGSLFFRAVLTF